MVLDSTIGSESPSHHGSLSLPPHRRSLPPTLAHLSYASSTSHLRPLRPTPLFPPWFHMLSLVNLCIPMHTRVLWLCMLDAADIHLAGYDERLSIHLYLIIITFQ